MTQRMLPTICRPFRALFYRPHVRGLTPPPMSFSPSDFLKHPKRAKNHVYGLLATCQTLGVFYLFVIDVASRRDADP